MKPFYVLLMAMLPALQSISQLPENAVQLTWATPSGSARQQAVGGAMVSLGGDITSNFINPAGLGLYKAGELVLSPGFFNLQTNTNYLGTSSPQTKAGSFSMGSSGLVMAMPYPEENGLVFSVAVNASANLQGHTNYGGLNNYSSFSEQFAAEFANSGLSISDALNSPLLSYGTRMALYTYLIDTATIGGVTQVIAQPQKILAANGSLNQTYNRSTGGSVYEVALSLAGNYKDKLYLGASLGIPIVNYNSNLTWTETDASANANNDFASAKYQESRSSVGAGVNVKLGAIYTLSPAWRIGLAIHTPTVYSLSDNITASMTTNTEGYAGVQSVNSATLDQASGVNAGNLKYDMSGPWRFMAGGSFLVGSGPTDSKRKGFVTADIEYSTTRSSKFSAPEIDNNNVDESFFSSLNSATRSFLKNTWGLRLGGEMKFNLIAARLGLAYYSDPYQNATLKADKFYFSGGLGYRNKGIFIDLAYVQGSIRNISVPYRIADKATTWAQLRQTSRSLVLTIGFKF